MPFIFEQCHTAIQQHSNVLLALFFAGLVGGFTHCAGMCGFFVSSQVIHRFDAQPLHKTTAMTRVIGAALLPYHLGRMTTYVVLAVISALLAKQIIGSPLQQGLSAVLLSLAGVVFVASSIPAMRRLNIKGISRFGQWLGTIAKPFFMKPTGLHGYRLGVLLGFLPCGLVFAALMIVSTTGNIFTAALAMIVFTLGTIPALFLVGYSSQFAFRRWPSPMQKVARGMMAVNGIILFVMAGKIVL